MTNEPGEYAALSAALAILCGIVFLLLGKFRMGFLSQFLSTAVQTGFLVGLGLTIMVGQLFKVFGISSIDGPFYKQAWHLVTHLDETSGWTLAIGGLSLAALLVLPKLAPGIPSALVMVAASIMVVTVLDLADKGVAIVGTVGRFEHDPRNGGQLNLLQKELPARGVVRDLEGGVVGKEGDIERGFGHINSVNAGGPGRSHRAIRS